MQVRLGVLVVVMVLCLLVVCLFRIEELLEATFLIALNLLECVSGIKANTGRFRFATWSVILIL